MNCTDLLKQPFYATNRVKLVKKMWDDFKVSCSSADKPDIAEMLMQLLPSDDDYIALFDQGIWRDCSMVQLILQKPDFTTFMQTSYPEWQKELCEKGWNFVSDAITNCLGLKSGTKCLITYQTLVLLVTLTQWK